MVELSLIDIPLAGGTCDHWNILNRPPSHYHLTPNEAGMFNEAQI